MAHNPRSDAPRCLTFLFPKRPGAEMPQSLAGPDLEAHAGRVATDELPQDPARHERPIRTGQSVDERDLAADQRDVAAAERDLAADERDLAADERDRIADEREVLADDRENAADERERMLDRRLAGGGESTLPPLTSAPELEQRRLDAIARGRARQAANEATVERNKALVQRMKVDAERQAADVARRAAEVKRTPNRPALRAVPSRRPLTWPELLEQFVETAMHLAETEEKIARDHEELALQQPKRADECRRVAEEAREGARRARELARRFGDGSET